MNRAIDFKKRGEVCQRDKSPQSRDRQKPWKTLASVAAAFHLSSRLSVYILRKAMVLLPNEVPAVERIAPGTAF